MEQIRITNTSPQYTMLGELRPNAVDPIAPGESYTMSIHGPSDPSVKKIEDLVRRGVVSVAPASIGAVSELVERLARTLNESERDLQSALLDEKTRLQREKDKVIRQMQAAGNQYAGKVEIRGGFPGIPPIGDVISGRVVPAAPPEPVKEPDAPESVPETPDDRPPAARRKILKGAKL